MEGYQGRVFMPGQVRDRINVFSTAWLFTAGRLR